MGIEIEDAPTGKRIALAYRTWNDLDDEGLRAWAAEALAGVPEEHLPLFAGEPGARFLFARA